MPGTDLLTFVHASRAVFDCDLVDSVTHADGLARHLRAEIKASALQVHPPQQVGRKQLIAGGLISQVYAKQQVADERDDLAAEPKADVVKMVLPNCRVPQVSRAVNDLRPVLSDRLKQQLELL